MKGMKLNIVPVGGHYDVKLEQVSIDKDNLLRSLQSHVGGSIECYDFIEPLYKNGITLCINENGKVDMLPPSVLIFQYGKCIETLNGNVIFLGYNKELCEHEDLTAEQIATIKSVFRTKRPVPVAHYGNVMHCDLFIVEI